MKPKQIAHCLIDLGMTALFLGLMAYSVIGQALHEWMGIALFVLFSLHHLLNLQWLQGVRKGRYTAVRILRTMLVALLFLSIMAQTISGIAMSRPALPFLDIPIPTSAARLLHLACGYWSFLLVSVHLGVHWSIFLGAGRKLRGGKPLLRAGKTALRLLAILELRAAMGYALSRIAAGGKRDRRK